MAGLAKRGSKNSPEPWSQDERRQKVREAAAKLYGQGVPRGKIARILLDELVPNGRDRPLEQRLGQARNKLRAWEKSDKFRDLVWYGSVVKLDLQTPAILDGIAAKARRGRVDAARLALEITGRHTKTGEAPPTQVQLVVNGVPRPTIKATAKMAELEAETVTIEADEAMVSEDDEI